MEVEPWCQWAWRAWHDLTDDRQWRGGGLGPATPCRIPWAAAMAYAAQHRLDPDSLLKLLRAMDEVFLVWHAEQVDRAAKAGDVE
ncbi:hypothetical protein [Azospirillum thermophilum]|uniref:hypothetical protein n=1 Tax=Azospirillum thermophilum TaxID=2202148 RepID=UPI001FEA0D4D|nr:hypothetical protein [Azospirillum thermophilum]